MQIDYPGMHVLALLHERPRHPYDMVRELRARHLDRSSRLGGLPRSLYHAVDRLAERNLIEPTETTREGNRPERTVYRITDEGRDEFDVGLRQLLETPTSEHPALAAGLGFAVYLTPGTVLDALEGRIVALTSEVAQLDAGLRALRQAELEWARSLADELRTGTLAWDWDSIAGHFAAEQARREALGRMS